MKEYPAGPSDALSLSEISPLDATSLLLEFVAIASWRGNDRW
jgi:hypothetical protein